MFIRCYDCEELAKISDVEYVMVVRDKTGRQVKVPMCPTCAQIMKDEE